jgi:hypothetical protein
LAPSFSRWRCYTCAAFYARSNKITVFGLTRDVVLQVAFFVLGVVGVFYPHSRGSVHVAVVVLYALTAAVGGYVSAALYQRCQSKGNWVRNVLQTSMLLTLPFFVVFCCENTVAVYHDVTTALPLSTIVPPHARASAVRIFIQEHR